MASDYVKRRYSPPVKRTGRRPYLPSPEGRMHVVADNGCWLWIGYLTPQGYGQVDRDGKKIPAHCYYYEALVGPVPVGMTLDHECHSRDDLCPGGPCEHRRCVNPAHLEPVTVGVNVLRGRSFSAVNAQKTHCKHGHLLDESNTYVIPSGAGRACRECRRIDSLKRYHERQGSQHG